MALLHPSPGYNFIYLRTVEGVLSGGEWRVMSGTRRVGEVEAIQSIRVPPQRGIHIILQQPQQELVMDSWCSPGSNDLSV